MTGVVPKLRTAQDSTSGRKAGKRRGGNLPARLRFSARRGVTLVELMISMLILTLVCVAWLEIIGIQSARKEARRREAVERLAGMMDAFIEITKGGTLLSDNKKSTFSKSRIKNKKYYRMKPNLNLYELEIGSANEKDVLQMFEKEDSPIGYRLYVVPRSEFPNQGDFSKNGVWTWDDGLWLFGELYNHSGDLDKDDIGPMFFSLRVALGL